MPVVRAIRGKRSNRDLGGIAQLYKLKRGMANREDDKDKSDLPTLSAGSIKSLVSDAGRNQPAILQVLRIESVGVDKYRMMLSDGENTAQAMLNPKLCDLVRENSLKQFSLIKVTAHALHNIKGRRYYTHLQPHQIKTADKMMLHIVVTL